ncbi:MAG: biotin carboxylase N-terminal domain-containing protein [Clostridiaceae bacterium]|nr:biotin carboxylase N-terminal domain-containing protein [Clostridiaceae bacterium]
MFSKILIANRGEIALRVIRACREMGIATVAVCSEADRDALPALLSDECVCVGGNSPRESYLNIRNILAAAELTGAQAIHPGYGFLSENPAFARACESAGIVFIGPPGDVLDRMGDKNNARLLAQSIGVPVIPGSEVARTLAEARAEAERIGFPLLIKACAGGGGKGIRIVGSLDALASAFVAASEEALAAFGDGRVYLEKYLTGVRHVEVQILADACGKILTLGERDCSLQCNRQKVVEETPCPALDAETREKLTAAAVKAARSAGYRGAGTVEFLLAPDKSFYFIEMNPRLQVEHGVSEEVSGVDIVKWQIRVAAGIPLPMEEGDVALRGCAIECRINAKSAGRIDFLHIPGGHRVHFDTALVQGGVVPPYYDSMLGKLIVYAATREEAVRKMEAALCELAVDGVDTNLTDQLALVRSKAFRAGLYDTLSLAEGRI